MSDFHLEAPDGRQEVLITRHIHAPRDVVFKTLVDPLLIPHWWGPEGSTTLVHEMLAVPGGIWRYVQTDKDGKEYAFHGVYHDVVAPERLVYTSEFEGTPGFVTLYTDELIVDGSDTVIKTRAVFHSLEDRDQKLRWGLEHGVAETTRRLNQLLAQTITLESNERKVTIMEQMENMEDNGECIHMTRTFDAPVEEVWDRWTDPDQYMCWWGPKDFTAPYARFDLRPGGTYLSCMRGPDGKEYWDTGRFEEIDELNRIVYTDTFADEQGNVVPPSYYGMEGDQPVQMSVQVNMEDIGGKTRMTLEHCGLTGRDMLDQAQAGWNQSFDKLAECLG